MKLNKRSKEAKYLQQHPEIKQCSIRIERLASIESMLQTNVVMRRSSRIISQTASQNVARATAISRTPSKKSVREIKSKSATKPKSRSLAQNTPAHAPIGSPIQVRSSMRKAHRCQTRSKSVSFDFGSPQHDNAPQVRRTLFNDAPPLGRSVSIDNIVDASGSNQNVPIDLTSYGRSSSASNGFNNSLGNNSNAPLVQANGSSSALQANGSLSAIQANGSSLSSNQVLAYQSRIDSLVESNQAKISRIQVLQAEKKSFMDQIETLHRINRSLTQIVDVYRANQENVQPANNNDVAKLQAEIQQFKEEVGGLKVRLDRMNRQNFELRSEVGRLQACLKTHSQKVLSEHNYNM